MNYWLISDTHFNHLRIEEWNQRSGDWQDSLWRSLESIPKEDVIIHLGDICIGDDVQVHERISRLQARKILIRGNHDGKSTQWYSEHGWDFVCDGLDLLFHGHYLWLTHRPQPPDKNHSTRNIHGHTHGNLHRSEEYTPWYDKEYHLDISPELVGFKAIRLDTLLKNSPRTQCRGR